MESSLPVTLSTFPERLIVTSELFALVANAVVKSAVFAFSARLAVTSEEFALAVKAAVVAYPLKS